METDTPLEVLDDDTSVEQVAHELMVRYGRRAAGTARGRAMLAANREDAQKWLDVANAIERGD